MVLDFIDLTYFLEVIVPALVAVVVGVIIEQFLESQISSLSEKGVPDFHVHRVKVVVRWLTVIVLVIVVAGIFGVSVGSLWVSISAILAMMLVGFFAGWSILANLLASILVMVWQPFEIGDRITVLPEDISGEIVDMNLFYGRIRTDDGDIVNVPNITFVTKFIKVSSKS